MKNVCDNTFSLLLCINMYIYNITAKTGVLPGEVRFDCAGPVFFMNFGMSAEWFAMVDEICIQLTNP